VNKSLESYSQWGDDVLCLQYFEGKSGCAFLEAGANDPVSLSQTYLLEQNGWTGVLVEPVPDCCKRLRDQRPNSKVYQNALGSPSDRGSLRLFMPGGVSELTRELRPEDTDAEGTIIEAQYMTLTEVLSDAGVERLTYLSLDLEGMEDRALEGFDFERFKPELIIVEDRVEHLRTHRLLKNRGFKLVRRNGSNNWYVPLSADFPVALKTRLRLFRKLYLSMPFRWLRRAMRSASSSQNK